MFLPRKFFARASCERPVQNLRAFHEFAPNVDVGQVHVIGVAGDDHPLEHLVRVFVNDLLVLERARLGFVGIADEVNRLAALAVHKRPLQAAGKARAAPAAQAGG